MKYRCGFLDQIGFISEILLSSQLELHSNGFQNKLMSNQGVPGC